MLNFENVIIFSTRTSSLIHLELLPQWECRRIFGHAEVDILDQMHRMVDLAITSRDLHSSTIIEASLLLCRIASIWRLMMSKSYIISFQWENFFCQTSGSPHLCWMMTPFSMGSERFSDLSFPSAGFLFSNLCCCWCWTTSCSNTKSWIWKLIL